MISDKFNITSIEYKHNEITIFIATQKININREKTFQERFCCKWNNIKHQVIDTSLFLYFTCYHLRTTMPTTKKLDVLGRIILPNETLILTAHAPIDN